MEPDDPKLSALLREWRVPDAPPALEQRVMDARRLDGSRSWWKFLLTGSIRIPVPVGLAIAAILVVMAVAVLRERPPEPRPASISLVDFRPVPDLNVRVIRGHESN